MAILLIFIILILMFGPPVFFFILGRKAKQNKEKAITYYILAVTYLVIGLGICGSILNSF